MNETKCRAVIGSNPIFSWPTEICAYNTGNVLAYMQFAELPNGVLRSLSLLDRIHSSDFEVPPHLQPTIGTTQYSLTLQSVLIPYYNLCQKCNQIKRSNKIWSHGKRSDLIHHCVHRGICGMCLALIKITIFYPSWLVTMPSGPSFFPAVRHGLVTNT